MNLKDAREIFGLAFVDLFHNGNQLNYLIKNRTVCSNIFFLIKLEKLI